jgi:hypothetical protein
MQMPILIQVQENIGGVHVLIIKQGCHACYKTLLQTNTVDISNYDFLYVCVGSK